VVSGTLSGILIALVAAWIWQLYGRIWRGSIAEEAAAALDAAAGLGLRVWPSRHTSAWFAAGAIESVQIRIAWRGGILGARTHLNVGGLKRSRALICTEAELRDVLREVEEE